MRRFLPGAVIALLSIVVATPVNAGYLIIRVILDGSGGGAGAQGGSSEGGLPGMPGMSSGGGRGGQPPVGSGRPGSGGAFGDGPPTSGGSSSGGLFGGFGSSGPVDFVHDPSRSLVIVVPIEEDLSVPTPFYRGQGHTVTNPIWKPKLHLPYRGQRFVTNLFSDGASVQWYEELLKVPSPRKTRSTEIKDLHYSWSKSKSDPKILYTVLTRAIEAGMIDDAVNYADELLAFATEKPEGLPPEIASFAKAYKAMQKGIKSPPAKPSEAEIWRSRLDAQGVHMQGHYALLYWDTSSGEVQRRAAMLEENFKGFYLWHATRGIELPIPESPLVAALAKSGQAVFSLARALDGPMRLSADGFYSVDHDLLVLSPERLDEVGQTFVRQVQQIYKAGAARDRLLLGEGPKLNIHGQNDGKRPEEVARMQTLALVDRLIEDQSAMATISREGGRQLLYASGRLPRYVVLPAWVNNGASNFFARPSDPAFITDAEGKTSMAVAIATGYGGPNYTLQRYFKDLLEKKELNTDRAAMLKSVLTDAYFRGLSDPKEVNDPDPAKPDSGIALHAGLTPSGGAGISGGVPPGPGGSRPGGFGGLGSPSGPSGFPPRGGGMQPPPGGGLGGRLPGGGSAGIGDGMGSPGGMVSQFPPQEDPNTLLRKKRERLGIKAQATAWALYYYLAKDRPNELQKFLDAIAMLPRDLPFEGDAVLNVFCQSFNLDGSKASLNRFADEWLEYIRSVPPAAVMPDIKLAEPKAQSPSSGPGGPGFPGFPGSGGPGDPGPGSN